MLLIRWPKYILHEKIVFISISIAIGNNFEAMSFLQYSFLMIKCYIGEDNGVEALFQSIEFIIIMISASGEYRNVLDRIVKTS